MSQWAREHPEGPSADEHYRDLADHLRQRRKDGDLEQRNPIGELMDQRNREIREEHDRRGEKN